MTKLVLIRHGYPLNEEEAGVDDEKLRPLSAKGIEKLHTLCKQLEREKLLPSQILCSPILRARQTGEILSNYFSKPLEISSSLGYDFEPDKLIAILKHLSEEEVLFCIGHNPNLSYFGQVLLQDPSQFEGLQPGWALALQCYEEVKASTAKLVRVLNS